MAGTPERQLRGVWKKSSNTWARSTISARPFQPPLRPPAPTALQRELKRSNRPTPGSPGLALEAAFGVAGAYLGTETRARGHTEKEARCILKRDLTGDDDRYGRARASINA
jgi:hypothetical protein